VITQHLQLNRHKLWKEFRIGLTPKR